MKSVINAEFLFCNETLILSQTLKFIFFVNTVKDKIFKQFLSKNWYRI